MVGPRCLLACLRAGTPVPEMPYPLYTAAMRGLNVERAFMSYGAGGAGQSITTAWLDAMFPELHAYIDMNTYMYT